jgi:Cu+-exporting ATPase
VEGVKVLCGTERLLAGAGIPIDATVTERVQRLVGEGKSVVLVARADHITGIIALADTLREEAGRALEELRELGVRRLLLLTGDHRRVAAIVADKLGLEFEAEALPEDKIRIIQRLQREGRVVAMVGDGINDAPALAEADVGIAMGTGTDVAIESSGVTLVKGDLRGIVKAVNLGRRTMRNIRQNLFFAFAYNTLGIPLAAGVLYPVFGLLLSPMIASAAMSLSSVSVITNALRLRRLALT